MGVLVKTSPAILGSTLGLVISENSNVYAITLHGAFADGGRATHGEGKGLIPVRAEGLGHEEGEDRADGSRISLGVGPQIHLVAPCLRVQVAKSDGRIRFHLLTFQAPKYQIL